MREQWVVIAGVVGMMTLAGAQTSLGAIAYNDFAAGTTAPVGKFVANILSGQSGPLVDYDTNATIATLTSSGGTNSATTGAGADIGSAGTPLYNHFNGFVNMTGSAFGSGQNVLTFSDLNPNLLYTVTIGINRGPTGPANAHWYQSLTIAGADSFTNTSTLADIGINTVPTTIPSITGPNDATTYATGNNNVQVNPSGPARISTDGAIVQYSDINPGIDGTFTVTLSLVQGDNQYLNGLSLAVVPEPASLGLLGIGALGLVARRRRPA